MALILYGYRISRDGVIASSFLVSLFFIVTVIYYATNSHPTTPSYPTTPISHPTTSSHKTTPSYQTTPSHLTTPSGSGCEIDPLQSEAPLLLISGTSNFTYPTHGDEVIKTQSNKAIDFACPGGSVVVNGKQLESVVTATCVMDQEFEIQNVRYRWSQISCSGRVYASATKSGRDCEGGNKEILIGFDLGNGRFAVVMSVCFNEKQEIAVYSQFELTSSIRIPQNQKSPSFYQDKDFYTVNKVDNYYKQETQKTTINKLLGLKLTSTKYIKKNSHFLSRGHLTARADFLYVAQQNATYRFLNVVPQWYALNTKNWEEAEKSTRNYASNNKVDLQIWTGTFNIATLPNDHNTQTDLYLYTDNNTKLLPVPAFFWKIVYNPKNEKGIALVSFNNPYKTQTEVKEEIFCNDVAVKVKWLTWDKTSLEYGYSFACTLTDFQKVVNVAPKLKDSGLLS